MDRLMSIGEFSARSGLSPKQLRSYAVTGLLAPSAVDSDSGYRYYAETMRLQAAGQTKTGPVRENNEDSITFRENFLAVADGMGGHSAGELASTLAVQAVAAIFTGKSADELGASVRAANWAVWERASTHPQLEGMGTTMCAVGVVDDGVIAIANVGDSRAYLARNGSLQRLTDDHTVPGELLREGKLTAQEAAQHPQRRLLTRALGVGADTAIDTTRLEVTVGDRLLLCTDGVFSSTPDEQLAQLLSEAKDPQAAADAVVDWALADDSDDNASAVVAFVTA